MDDVPLVGQQLEVFECIPLVTVLCNCHDDNRPFVIPGVDVAKMCHRCKRTFAIIKVEYERSPMGPSIVKATVGIMSQNGPLQ